MKQKLFQISAVDDVAVVLSALTANETYGEIPFAHKVALRDIRKGETIVKYGYPIGHAIEEIKRGEHVHSHNLKTNLSGYQEYVYRPNHREMKPRKEDLFFQGYLRQDGRAGTRNDVWIIPTVGCVAHMANKLAEEAEKRFPGRVDHILALGHNTGCSQMGEDQERTMRILAGLAANPNAGGVLLLSLGCENNHLDIFKPYLADIPQEKLRFLVAQDADDEWETALSLLDELTAYAKSFRRSNLPADKLTIGLKCGGSDALSGVTANALCGRFSDALCSCGGTAIMTEVPEMFGAEHLLMERAISEDVFHDIVRLINDYKDYFLRHHQVIYENPSPGNKAGGITTLEEKSLGCVQKSGTSPVNGVLGYGQYVERAGLHLLTGSGNDEVSSTNLAASGATLICFTTGRGNPFGAPVPTIKISSNTPLATRKPHWIDFDAGRVLDDESVKDVDRRFMEYILTTASGEVLTNNEKHGYQSISVFRDGVIL